MRKPEPPLSLDLEVDEETESERPTVVPQYDVEAFARESGVASSPPATVKYREQMATVTDPLELEAARIVSTFSSLPPAMGSAEVEGAVLAEYEARLGSFARIPTVTVDALSLSKLPLDQRAGFVLALIDGTLNIEQILDVSGLPAPDTLGILQDLCERKIVTLRG